MSFLEKIRSKPQEEKIRLIWTITISAGVVLVALWIILARFDKALPKDTSLFKTIGQGITDVKNNYKK